MTLEYYERIDCVTVIDAIYDLQHRSTVGDGALEYKLQTVVVVSDLTHLYCEGTIFPHSLPSVRPGADPGAQAVSPQVT